MWSGGGGWARNDLEDYRAHYPKNSDDPALNDNLLFFRNQKAMQPEGFLIEEFLEEKYGACEYLEYCHSFIQCIFPIQEQGLNWKAQILQKHEILAMKADPEVMRRVVRVFDLMLDFYGFKLLVNPNPHQIAATTTPGAASSSATSSASAAAAASTSAASAAVATNGAEVDGKPDQAAQPHASHETTPQQPSTQQEQQQQQQHQQHQEQEQEQQLPETAPTLKTTLDSMSPADLAAATVVIGRNNQHVRRFDNLNTSGHNYLRITRMLKFLGEMNLENFKIAWLVTFERELFQGSLLYSCLSSYQNYWLGTIYDEQIRAEFERRAKAGAEAVREQAEAAYQARYRSYYSTSSASASTHSTTTTGVGHDTASSNRVNTSGFEDGPTFATNRAPVMFRLNSSEGDEDAGAAPAASGTTTAAAAAVPPTTTTTTSAAAVTEPQQEDKTESHQ